MTLQVRRLSAGDAAAMRRLNALFSEAFDDAASYPADEPGESYLQRVLGGDGVIVLVAVEDEQLTGGLVAYVLPKLEQERSEIYIYDLAVAKSHRRREIATALIEETRRIAAEIGAWVIYVQADRGDDPAIALYERLGTREDVLHFDIPPAALQ